MGVVSFDAAAFKAEDYCQGGGYSDRALFPTLKPDPRWATARWRDTRTTCSANRPVWRIGGVLDEGPRSRCHRRPVLYTTLGDSLAEPDGSRRPTMRPP